MVQNGDVKLFVKGSQVCSSKWSSADDSTPTHDNSHGRNFRGGGGGGGKEHKTVSEMNARKWIHMPPIHGRQVIEKMLTIDNTHLSYRQMESIETKFQQVWKGCVLQRWSHICPWLVFI